MMKKLQLFFLLFSFSFFAVYSQNYNMQNGSITTCSGNFYDSGGPTGNYANSQNFTMTINPAIPGQGIRVTFTSFHLESATWDNLKIYDGPTTASTLIGTFGGTVSPGIIESSFGNTSGSLTFVFISDNSVNHPGWAATISCFTPVFVEQYLMTNNGSATTCSGVFYDSGGQYGNYANNQNLVYTINSGTPGQKVRLTFTQLNIEESYDRLFIYDGNTTAAPLLTILSGTPTVMPIITASATNTSGSLTFRFTSDAVINTAGWAAQISCVVPETVSDVYNMQNGTVTTCSGSFYDSGGVYGYYNDNENYTMTFCPANPVTAMKITFSNFNLIAGDVLTIYDGNSTAAPILGTFTGTNNPGAVGATTNNASRCLTVRFTSNTSVIRSGWVATLSCYIPTVPNQPQFSNCSTLTANDDDAVGCAGGPCVDLSAVVSFATVAGGANTTAYNIANANCLPTFQPGTPVSVNIDDRWSSPINITFPFSFFGNTYNQLLIGSNGLLTFDLANAGGFCPWSFNAAAPNTALPRNAIFGAYHDIDPSVCGQISYFISGTAPYRTFVVTFNNVCHFSCTTLKTKQHIVLYETSNIIDVIIENKPTCTTWNSGNALIGLQNAAGTIAYVPPGRNTGPWSASNEQWRFIPDDQIAIPYTFSWQDANDNILSTNLNYTVCPTQTTTYTAHLEYSILGQNFVKEEDVVITYTGAATVQANQPNPMQTCLKFGAAVFDLTQAAPQVIGNQTNVSISYYTSQANADAGTNPLTNAQASFFAVSQNYVVWIRVDDNTNTGCYALTSLQLQIVPENQYPVTQPGNLTVCANAINSLVGTFNLSVQTPIISSGLPNTVTYHLTLADAESGSFAITNIQNFNNTVNNQVIYARVENSFGCYNTTSFMLIVNPLPVSTVTMSQSVCNLGNGTGVFNLPNIGNFTTRYYTTLAAAQAGGSNFITNPQFYTSAATTLYVNLSNPSTGCQAVEPYQLNLYALPTATQPANLQSCNIGNGFAVFNIQDVIPSIVGNQSNVTVTYHQSQQDANTGSNVISSSWISFVSVQRTIFVRVQNQNGCFVTTTLSLVVNNCPPQIPNGFSPNDDNINDKLTITGLKDVFKNFKFTVFNRWGNVVYKTDNNNIKFISGNTGSAILWDGSVDGIISKNPEATTYYYILEYNDGQNDPAKGWIYVNP